MSQNELAKLSIVMETQTEKLQKGFDAAEKRSKLWEKRYKKSIGSVNGVVKAFIGLFAAHKIKGFYTAHIDGIDKLAKQSAKLGVTVDALQGLRHAGELSGVSINTMDMAVQRMTRRVAEAAKGTGEARDAIKELGLSAEYLASLRPDQQMIMISKAMEGVSSQGDRVRLAMKLFDSEGVALVNTLAMGEEGLRNAAKEVEGLGLSLSSVDVAKVELANDAFTKVGKSSGAFGRRIAVETAPILGAMADLFLENAANAGGLGTVSQKLSRTIVTGIGFAADAVHGLKVVFLTVRQMVAEVFNETVELITLPARLGGGLAKKLGFDIEAINKVNQFKDSINQTTSSLREELSDAAMAPLPGEKIRAYLNQTLDKFEVEARTIASEREGLLGNLIGDDGTKDGESDKIDKQRDINNHFEQLELGHYQRRFKNQKYFESLFTRFKKSAAIGRVGIALGEAGEILKIFSAGSKKMFKASKIAGISSALISTYQGIAAGVKLGWPKAIPAVAWAAANGFKQVRALQSQKYGGGGGGTPSVSSAAEPPSISDVSVPTSFGVEQLENVSQQQQTPQSTVIFNGDIFAEGAEEQIIDILVRAFDNQRVRAVDQNGEIIVER
jgi:hypothetical protein